MIIRLAPWTFAAALLVSTDALAQPPTSPFQTPFRKWDAIGGLELRFGQQDDVVVPAADWNAEFGRYWTPHLKTSVTVATTGAGSYSGSYTSTTWTDAETTPGRAGFAGTVTYQFLDNVFAHPYVVGGLRMTSVSDVTRTYSATSYQLLSTVAGPSRLEARPILGGGFKSYFDNGRAFMRSELLLAVGPQGTAHTVLRVGAGVDF